MPSDVHLISHPLIAQNLTALREETTSTASFRQELRSVARLMTPSVTADLATTSVPVKTPLTETTGSVLARPLIIVPILRAGLGMAEAVMDMIPDASVAHLGLARDEETHEPKVYYQNYPSNFSASDLILVDPMLATGGSAIAAASLLKENGASSIRFLNLVSCPEGIEAFHQSHPDIPIYTAAIDEGLNDQAYIVPGLGDAGDRYFGTH